MRSARGVVGCGGRVHEDQALAGVVVDEACRRVDDQARAGHDQQVRLRDRLDGALDDVSVQHLPVEHDVRSQYRGAGGAVGNRAGAGVVDVGERESFIAAGAGQARPVAVQLEDLLGAGPLVEAVNVLRDHGRQLPGPLESGHEPVRRVGGYALAGVLLGEPLPVGLRVHGEEVDGQHLLQGNLPVLVVEALGAPEVGIPTRSRPQRRRRRRCGWTLQSTERAGPTGCPGDPCTPP